MRRFAGPALASGFAICALVPLTILAGAAGASAVRSPRAAGAVSATPAPSASVSASPKPTGAAGPTGQPVPPPTQQAAPPGPPKPVRGMPEPSANCLSQRGRTHLTSEPWAQRALGFSSVWDLTRGQRITVAVVDSGIDYTPQLAGRVSRVDLTGGTGEDCIPHGTDVASIIAASDARARGIPFYGVAPAARILSIRVQQQEGTGGQTSAQRRKTLMDIARGIRYAVAEHAKVINVSIQVSASYPALRAAVAFALRHNAVVVAAAGNDNPGGGQGPFYPASYPGVLSVNAVDQYGQLGGFDVSRTPVSVTAPGVNVASDYPGGFDPSNNGTSFATAFVSGEAALVRAAYPRLTAAQVVHRIIATAAGRTGAHTGAGMINPVQAVTAVLPPRPAASPLPHQVRVPRPRALNSLTRTVALSVTGGALVTAALVAIGAIVVPLGRRRRWRPGSLPQAPLASPAPASALTSPAPAPAPATPGEGAPSGDPLPAPAPPGERRQRLILSRTELRARITLCRPPASARLRPVLRGVPAAAHLAVPPRPATVRRRGGGAPEPGSGRDGSRPAGNQQARRDRTCRADTAAPGRPARHAGPALGCAACHAGPAFGCAACHAEHLAQSRACRPAATYCVWAGTRRAGPADCDRGVTTRCRAPHHPGTTSRYPTPSCGRPPPRRRPAPRTHAATCSRRNPGNPGSSRPGFPVTGRTTSPTPQIDAHPPASAGRWCGRWRFASCHTTGRHPLLSIGAS